MKNSKIALCLALLACGLVWGCKKNHYDQEIPFVAKFEIPAGLGTILTYNIRTNGVVGTTIANIVSAQVTRIQFFIEIGEPSFDFVRQAYFHIVTDTSTTEIGYLLDNPMRNSTNMTIAPDIFDAKQFITRPSFDVMLKLNLRSSTLQTSRIRVEFYVGLKTS